MRCFLSILAVAAIVCTLSCDTGAPPRGGGGKPRVFVSVAPLAFFAQRIGDDHVDVEVLVGPGHSPATYEPTTKQMARLGQAAVFFSVGVPVETVLLPKIRSDFPTVRIVDTRRGIDLMHPSYELLSGEQGESRAGQHGGAEAHDPHVWLSPRCAVTIAANIRDALIAIDPAHENDYRANYDTLDTALEVLDAQIAKRLASIRGRDIVVVHPAYGYFAQAYGLHQLAVEVGGVTPGSKHVVRLIERAREMHVKAIFVQPQFSSATAEAVADAVGAKLIPLDPLDPDYLTNLRRIAITIQSTYANG